MVAGLDYDGEDPDEVVYVAIRIYSKDMSCGNTEDYEKLKAQWTEKAAEGEYPPWEYMDRATAAIKYKRKQEAGSQKKVQGVFMIVIGMAMVASAYLAMHMPHAVMLSSR